MKHEKDAKTALTESIREMNEMLFRKNQIDSKLYESIKADFKLPEEARSMTGEQFANIRRHLKLSQAALGKLLGASVSTICKWERNANPVNAPTALLMSVLSKHGLQILR